VLQRKAALARLQGDAYVDSLAGLKRGRAAADLLSPAAAPALAASGVAATGATGRQRSSRGQMR